MSAERGPGGAATSSPTESADLAAAELAALGVWHRLHVRLALIYGGVGLFTLLLLTVLCYTLVVRSQIGALQERIRGVAATAALGLDGDAVAAEDPTVPGALHDAVADRIGRILDAQPDVDSVYVLVKTDRPGILRFFADRSRASRSATPGEEYDASEIPEMLRGLDAPAVDAEPVHDNFGTSLSGYAPIRRADGRSIGLVGIDVDAAAIDEMKSTVLRSAATIAALAVLSLGLAAGAAARLLREPLVALIAGNVAVAGGRLNTRLGLQRRDEFGVLARHFNAMASGLEERETIRATFGRYMSEEVAVALLKNPEALRLGGEEREVTILFSDLRGYSTISEHLGPTEVVNLLNDYLAVMNAAIDAEGGCVIEFLGDAILAVFGAPVPLPDHPTRAVRCALEMRTQLEALNASWDKSGLSKIWQSRGLAALAQRVGIHTGRVVAGNLGSSHRMKYAVIGDAVNVAARLEALNKELGTTILISDVVCESLSTGLACKAVDRGEHRVKGRDQVVRVWSL